MKKIINFLISLFFKDDKYITIHRIKNGNFKWYLYANGKLQCMSHPVQGYDTIQDCTRSIHTIYRFDPPKITINQSCK